MIDRGQNACCQTQRRVEDGASGPEVGQVCIVGQRQEVGTAAEPRRTPDGRAVYTATVGETGWPYIQPRGGPTGFVRVLDEETIGFADFRGNCQNISVGNQTTDDRVALFFMDYAGKTRLKLFGRARIIGPEERTVLARLAMPDHRGRIERGIVVTVEGFDWNCPQHITERYTLAEVQAATAALTGRIAELEAELAGRASG